MYTESEIEFFSNDELNWFELQSKEKNYYNAYCYFLETESGDSAICRSNVKHELKEVRENVERVALVFNTFSGEFGKGKFSNSLSIKQNWF